MDGHELYLIPQFYYFAISMASLRLRLPLYKALPVITPTTPDSVNGNIFLISSIVETPPEATTGMETASAKRRVSSMFGPVCIPSLWMSVKLIAATPLSRINAHNNPTGECLTDVFHKNWVYDRLRADNDPLNAKAQ